MFGSHRNLVVWVITGTITPNQPAALKPVLCEAGGWSLRPIKWEPVIASQVIPNKRWRSHRQPCGGSLVWRTDGCVGMTGCLCIHHQCKHLWFHTKACRQGGYSPQPCLALFSVHTAGWLGVIIPVITYPDN